jgi:hypothetical protein
MPQRAAHSAGLGGRAGDSSRTLKAKTKKAALNPLKFGGLANTKQEPWKLPLLEYIEELYIKHFKKSRPDNCSFP